MRRFRLFIDGHNHRRGYVIEAELRRDLWPLEYGPRDGRQRPLRFYQSRQKALTVVARFNRRFGFPEHESIAGRL